MELTDEFEVPLPIAEAWAVLTDFEKVGPCVPGAELREVEGDELRGVMKFKVGTATVSYRLEVRFESLDAGAHKAVLKAEGREVRGQGNLTALVTATLSPARAGTRVAGRRGPVRQRQARPFRPGRGGPGLGQARRRVRPESRISRARCA